MKRLLSAILVLCTGCATIDRGPMQRVSIQSEPAGAVVELEECGTQREDFRTPVTVLISRRVKRCTIIVTREGYEPARIMLERRRAAPAPGTSGVEVAEAICGPGIVDCSDLTDLLVLGAVGALGWGLGKGVDAIAGANYELEPREVWVELRPLDAIRRSEAPSAP